KALMNILSLELENWPVRRLLSLLNSGLFRPDWGSLAREAALREAAQVLREGPARDGRERILESLQRRTPPAGTAATSEQIAAERAGRLLGRLSDAMRPLRRAHDLTAWSGVIASLARVFGFHHRPVGAEMPQHRQSFGELLSAILFDASRADRVTGIEPAQMTLK